VLCSGKIKNLIISEQTTHSSAVGVVCQSAVLLHNTEKCSKEVDRFQGLSETYVHRFRDFPGLENVILKFMDFPGSVPTLKHCVIDVHVGLRLQLC